MTPFYAQHGGTRGSQCAAFWLPFQNIASSNHIAQWTEQSW
jgi:hypothetical protein